MTARGVQRTITRVATCVLSLTRVGQPTFRPCHGSIRLIMRVGCFRANQLSAFSFAVLDFAVDRVKLELPSDFFLRAGMTSTLDYWLTKVELPQLTQCMDEETSNQFEQERSHAGRYSARRRQ